MNYDTINNISAMVHMQAQGSDPQAMPACLSAQPLPNEDAAASSLDAVLTVLARHGAEAGRLAEQQLEAQQDCFLALLHDQLKKAGITLSEKLSISLSPEQTLVLQSTEDDEALLNALAVDTELQNMFIHLQSLAVTARGIQYLSATTQHPPHDAPAQYRMCLKGALSHFYLK